jgi:hypothetical protein
MIETSSGWNAAGRTLASGLGAPVDMPPYPFVALLLPPWLFDSRSLCNEAHGGFLGAVCQACELDFDRRELVKMKAW